MLVSAIHQYESAISSVQSLSVQFFETPWTAICQASLFITNSWSLLTLMVVHMPPPSWTSLPPPTPSHPFRLSQSTGFELHASYSKIFTGYLILHMVMYVPMLLSQFVPPQASSCGCSVAKSCPTLCGPMDCSTPDFPVLHHLLELAQTHVHWVGNVIQPSHSLSPPFLSSPSPLALNLASYIYLQSFPYGINCPLIKI